jgi:hypothetical protein
MKNKQAMVTYRRARSQRASNQAQTIINSSLPTSKDASASKLLKRSQTQKLGS